ncbi:MAG: diacylglycerol/lipid kinase family protein, partial [Chloroflexota bacterium]
MYIRIAVIINPAAGQDQPVLGTFNRVFQAAGVDWEVFVTKRGGDACRYAEAATRQDFDAVAVYGGDGTVAEVASGLIGGDVPMAIFPGGTANVMSSELGIPRDLAEACALIYDQASV